MKKKLMVFLTATILMFSLVGCGVSEGTESIEANNSGTKIEISSYYNAYEFIDPDTGVHYLYLYKGGITPRLNSDGSVMCDK